MRDPGLLVRELEPPFLQEVSHERLDLITKEFLRCAGDQESSSPGEFHPQALTEPDGSLSAHPALITRPGPRLPAQFLPIAGLTGRRNGDSDGVSPPASSPSLG